MQITQKGRQTWLFDGPVGIIGQAATCGPREGEGPLAADFDHIFPNLRMGEVSFEKAADGGICRSAGYRQSQFNAR